MSESTIGIVGYGQMGRFMAQLLSPWAKVLAYDPVPPRSVHQDGPVELADVARVAACPIVFLFPPIPKISQCCELIADHLRPGTLVVEGCSVMCHPTREMVRLLPSHVDLVGCHPLFGPQSGASGLQGFKVVLSAVRTERLEVVASLFRRLELEVVQMSPEQHDKAMARTQALEQLLGRTLMKLGVGPEPIDVPGYRKLVEVKQMLEHDSEELFLAVHQHNPFAAEVRERLQLALADLMRQLESRP
jgi:prephenate dehydrogenase